MSCSFFSCVVIALKSFFWSNSPFDMRFFRDFFNSHAIQSVFFHIQIMQTIDKNNVNIELFVTNATYSTRHTRFDFFTVISTVCIYFLFQFVVLVFSADLTFLFILLLHAHSSIWSLMVKENSHWTETWFDFFYSHNCHTQKIYLI